MLRTTLEDKAGFIWIASIEWFIPLRRAKPGKIPENEFQDNWVEGR